jgi:arsenate reductase
LTKNPEPAAWGPQAVIRLLFLCTGNSARSILAEAAVNAGQLHFDGRRVVAHSAGSSPAGKVHPGALDLLQRRNIDTGELHSKSWDTFAGESAPVFRWVITLCDRAAAEQCPTFSGPAEHLHWPLPDPASGAATFEATWDDLNQRIKILLNER